MTRTRRYLFAGFALESGQVELPQSFFTVILPRRGVSTSLYSQLGWIPFFMWSASFRKCYSNFSISFSNR